MLFYSISLCYSYSFINCHGLILVNLHSKQQKTIRIIFRKLTRRILYKFFMMLFQTKSFMQKLTSNLLACKYNFFIKICQHKQIFASTKKATKSRVHSHKMFDRKLVSINNIIFWWQIQT